MLWVAKGKQTIKYVYLKNINIPNTTECCGIKGDLIRWPGCVPPPLFSLYTNDWTSSDPTVKLLKVADDTIVIGLIQDGDGSAERLVLWCSSTAVFQSVLVSTLTWGSEAGAHCCYTWSESRLGSTTKDSGSEMKNQMMYYLYSDLCIEKTDKH